jgi:hypothetical protein
MPLTDGRMKSVGSTDTKKEIASSFKGRCGWIFYNQN